MAHERSNPLCKVSSMAGEGVGGLLAHKVCSSRLKFSLERFLFLFCSLVLFPAARTPIRACDRSRSSNLINAIFWKRNLGAPNLIRRKAKSILKQVRQRATLTSQSGLNFR